MYSFANAPDDVGPTVEERLQEVGIDTSVSNLRHIVNDVGVEQEVRYLAAVALGRSGDPSILSELEKTLQDSDAELRIAAVIGLRELGDAVATTALAEVLETDPVPVVQQVAITALEVFGTAEVGNILLRTASTPSNDLETRTNALMAISRLINSNQIEYADMSAALFDLLGDSNREVRAFSAIAMAQADDQRVVRQLVEASLDPTLDGWIQARVVFGLEQITDQRFGYFNESGGLEDAAKRHQATNMIRSWWFESSSSQGLKTEYVEHI